MLVSTLCFATISYSHEESGNAVQEVEAVQGLWVGSYGGGQRDGVVYQPALAELFIQGDHIEVSGYPSTVAGTFRLDPKAKQIKVTCSDESNGKTIVSTLEYGYEIKGDKLTMSGGDKRSITFSKRDVVHDPLANVEIEIVTAQGINKAGDLLVTAYTELEAGQFRATYFETQRRSLKTKRATVFVVQKTGCKNVSLDEARGLLRESIPVVIAYCREDRRPSDPSSQLAKKVGRPAPTGQAARRMFSRILQPGTLVFVLSAKENAPVP
jgi:hypothetical protein